MFLQLCKFPHDPEGLSSANARDRWIAQTGKHRDLDEGVTSRHRRSPQYSARKIYPWLK